MNPLEYILETHVGEYSTASFFSTCISLMWAIDFISVIIRFLSSMLKKLMISYIHIVPFCNYLENNKENYEKRQQFK